jgi:hypothetical protein
MCTVVHILSHRGRPQYPGLALARRAGVVLHSVSTNSRAMVIWSSKGTSPVDKTKHPVRTTERRVNLLRATQPLRGGQGLSTTRTVIPVAPDSIVSQHPNLAQPSRIPFVSADHPWYCVHRGGDSPPWTATRSPVPTKCRLSTDGRGNS